MHQADLAMYQAKLAGKNQYCIFAASDVPTTVVCDGQIPLTEVEHLQ